MVRLRRKRWRHARRNTVSPGERERKISLCAHDPRLSVLTECAYLHISDPLSTSSSFNRFGMRLRYLEYIQCLKEGTSLDSFFTCQVKQKAFYKCYEKERGHLKSKFAAMTESRDPLARLQKSSEQDTTKDGK
eukprot:7930736-Pyramimonas_sp.AAC.1